MFSWGKPHLGLPVRAGVKWRFSLYSCTLERGLKNFSPWKREPTYCITGEFEKFFSSNILRETIESLGRCVYIDRKVIGGGVSPFTMGDDSPAPPRAPIDNRHVEVFM